jgi:hypothetical protein
MPQNSRQEEDQPHPHSSSPEFDCARCAVNGESTWRKPNGKVKKCGIATRWDRVGSLVSVEARKGRRERTTCSKGTALRESRRERSSKHKTRQAPNKSSVRSETSRATLCLQFRVSEKQRRLPGRRPWPQMRVQPECRASLIPFGEIPARIRVPPAKRNIKFR